MIKIIEESFAYKGYLKVKEAVVEHVFKNGITNTYSRFKLDRPDAVAILIYNRDTHKVILTKQFRYPIFDREDDFILEVVAGKIDGNEKPSIAAAREVMEEVGYKINPDSLIEPIMSYPSPGYTNERIYSFLAVVGNADKDNNSGGGLDTENEEIEIIEMDFNEFMESVSKNKIQDAKTIICASLMLGFTFDK